MVVSGAGAVVTSHDEYDEPLLNSTTCSHDGGERSNSSSSIVEDTFVYFGLASNLISYLTGPLHQSTVTAAANVNAWVGVTWMLPLSAFLADSCLGQFHTILFSSLIDILGLGFLTLSVLIPSISLLDCPNNTENNTSCGSPSTFQVIFFFFSLYLVAIGSSGYRPCAQAFGADQFDGRNLDEYKSKSSFFKCWYFGLSIGSILAHLFLNYVQDNLSWALGFGISCISMIVALFVFLFGTKTYRYNVKVDNENPLLGIARVFVATAKNWRAMVPKVDQEEAIMGMFLDKALIDTSNNQIGSRKHGIPCSISQVQDAKAVLRLVPIWTTCLIYPVVVAQSPTFFTKQSSTMDRSIGPEFQIPAASIQIFETLSILLFIIIYDRLFVPFARGFTGKPNGITMLQRIGGGMFFSTIAMMVAAVIEKKRLQTAIDFGLADDPKATIPMRVCILGIGNFLSGFLISFIEKMMTPRRGGSYGWFPNNVNQGHLDYFYWLLAGLSIIQLVVGIPPYNLEVLGSKLFGCGITIE
ncbi:Proton-dependent oligopeptide transporter family [Macleaya cordata]|uniref:Proton-dependent oligopeptide transporter family n=1 Tax=Macleaya cordata TaxID=56857 RepID=A0A200Q6S1_MACCD|nr:Proton-dependent oligopeptide transporter family [Macleaya cordata]